MNSSADPLLFFNGTKYHYEKSKELNVDVELEPGMQIRGLNHMKLTNVHTQHPLFSSSINVSSRYTLDKLRFEGVYFLKGKALGLLPISGKGDFWVETEQLTGPINMVISYNGTQFAVKSVNFDLDLDKVKQDFKHLGVPGFQKLASGVMNNFSINLINQVMFYNQQTRQELDKILQEAFNKELKKLDHAFVKQIYAFFGFWRNLSQS